MNLQSKIQKLKYAVELLEDSLQELYRELDEIEVLIERDLPVTSSVTEGAA